MAIVALAELAKQWCTFSAKRPGTNTAITMEGQLDLQFEIDYWSARGFTEVLKMVVICG